MKLRELTGIDRIVIHCTASDHPADNSLKAVRKLHTSPESLLVDWKGELVAGRNFEDIGYNKLITLDGRLWPGRAEYYEGAHCFGQNGRSLGIALCGEKTFSLAQFKTLLTQLDIWKKQYGLKDSDIYGHYAFSDKPCPNFLVNI